MTVKKDITTSGDRHTASGDSEENTIIPPPKKNVTRSGDKLNANGGSEAVVTAKTRSGWVKFRECGEVIYGKYFSFNPTKKFTRAARNQPYYMKAKHSARKIQKLLS